MFTYLLTIPPPPLPPSPVSNKPYGFCGRKAPCLLIIPSISPHLCPSSIILMVSVVVKHHVYLLSISPSIVPHLCPSLIILMAFCRRKAPSKKKTLGRWSHYFCAVIAGRDSTSRCRVSGPVDAICQLFGETRSTLMFSCGLGGDPNRLQNNAQGRQEIAVEF